jgi:hypothetical protein
MVRGIGIGVPPLGIESCIIFQTNHLPVLNLQDLESKGDDLQDLQNAGVMVSLETSGDTSLRLMVSVSACVQLYMGCQAGGVDSR